MSGEHNRILPSSDTDFNMLTTDSTWGSSEVPYELRDALSRFVDGFDADGKQVLTKKSLWGLLGFYTRDIRLGNLSEFNNELQSCRFWLDFAHDMLLDDMYEPFMVGLSRAVCILETSQSKKGFLRRLMNTLRHENVQQTIEPPKKGFLGGYKKEGGGY
jgi:hypothetical protein